LARKWVLAFERNKQTGDLRLKGIVSRKTKGVRSKDRGHNLISHRSKRVNPMDKTKKGFPAVQDFGRSRCCGTPAKPGRLGKKAKKREGTVRKRP